MLAFIFIFACSCYSLFIANDARRVAMGLLRVALSTLGVVATKFDQPGVLTLSVLLYCLVSLSLLAIMRNEVQLKND